MSYGTYIFQRYFIDYIHILEVIQNNPFLRLSSRYSHLHGRGKCTLWTSSRIDGCVLISQLSSHNVYSFFCFFFNLKSYIINNMFYVNKYSEVSWFIVGLYSLSGLNC
jgi:hypothetical protein